METELEIETELISPKSSDIKCSICLDEDVESNDLCSTGCDHQFCKSCLDEWFDQGKISCPMCREEIKYFEHDNEKNRIVKLSSSIGEINDNNTLNLIRLIHKQKIRLRIYKTFNYVLLFYNVYLSLKNSLLYNKIHEYHNDYIDCSNNVTDLIDENKALSDHNKDLLNSCNGNFNGFIDIYLYGDHGEQYSCSIPEFFIQKCIAN